MGSSNLESDVTLAEVEFDDELLSPTPTNVLNNPHQVHTRDHRKHRKKKDPVTNGDSDIITPYQNGHTINAKTNGYNNHWVNYQETNVGGGYLNGVGNLESSLRQSIHRSSNDFISPPPPHHLQLQSLVEEEREVESSLSSTNNAITVAPSRTSFNESNVFAGGRPNNLKRANRNNRHRHHQHRRSRTPDFGTSNHRLKIDDGEAHDSQSILNRIDLSIRKNFGEWDCDEEEIRKKMFAVQVNPGKSSLNRVPYFIPKTVSDSDVGRLDDVNLPRLFKPYENVVQTSKQVLNDKAYKIALSRDNADPNSILSQAKKTLSLVGGNMS